MISLRTTLATATCSLYIDTATALGDAFDPLMDTLLPHLLKLSGSTKKLVAEASQHVTAAIIDHAACHPRVFVPFLEQGLGERTVQSRGHFMAHVARYIATQARRPGGKHAVEGTTLLNSSQSTALALLADLIRRGLTDPNPGVKESARAAFVVFYREWPRQGAVLLGGLEEGVRKQVDKALASAAAATADVPTTARSDSAETLPPPTAPKAPAPTAARRAPAARKPSSAIAAAIRKAKEEQKAARLAEAEAQAMAANDGGGEEAALEQQTEVLAEQQADGQSRENDANGTHDSNNGEVQEVVKIFNPVESRTESPVNSPATPTSPQAPKTPVKTVSLLDFQTPEGSSGAFKVMTPAPVRVAQPDLVETTETSLSEPVNPIPSDGPPTITVADSEVMSSPAQDEDLPEAPKPRRPRESVNPVAGMGKPQPLYTKLGTLVDCSYWLDRQQGECEFWGTERIADSLVPRLSRRLRRRASGLAAAELITGDSVRHLGLYRLVQPTCAKPASGRA
jgi:CLIP-associating protein 1/2